MQIPGTPGFSHLLSEENRAAGVGVYVSGVRRMTSGILAAAASFIVCMKVALGVGWTGGTTAVAAAAAAADVAP